MKNIIVWMMWSRFKAKYSRVAFREILDRWFRDFVFERNNGKVFLSLWIKTLFWFKRPLLYILGL